MSNPEVTIPDKQTQAATRALINKVERTLSQISTAEGRAIEGYLVAKKLEEIGKDGKEFARAEILAKAPASLETVRVKSWAGEAVISTVIKTPEKTAKQELVDYLLNTGLATDAVTISAELRPEVSASDITQEDMDVIDKYFGLVYHVDMERVEALVTLGKLRQEDVDELCEVKEFPAQTRVRVNPSKQIKSSYDI